MADQETVAVEVLTDDEQIARLIAGTTDADELWAQQDPEEAARAIVARILSSEDEDAVFGLGAKATPADEVTDVPLIVRDVRFAASSFEAGPSVYALIDAVDDSGEKLTVSCGSRNVMAQLHWLKVHGKLPTGYAVTISRAERATAGGFYPMWLRKYDAEA